jgi:predicted nucleotidyltransferase
MNIPNSINTIIYEQPYPLLFSTISGSHLYGFPSPDSDYDLRGVHILPVREVVGLNTVPETIELSQISESLQIDLVTHDVKKFFLLLLKKNGYVLEQLYSPLILKTTPEYEELKVIANDCITRHHCYHYFGFAATQWKLFEKEQPRRVKPLLYVYRVLLTGIYLMQTGVLEANLVKLNEIFDLSYIPDLIAAKLTNVEKSVLPDADLTFHQQEYNRLRDRLQVTSQASQLPEAPTAKAALNDLLIRLRVRS